jgi:hypothetical protein
VFALADIPWEYMYVAAPSTRRDEQTVEGFLALNRRVSIVRHEDLQGAAVTSLEPLDSKKVRVVAATASPPGFPPPLDVAKERDFIEAAFARHLDVTTDFISDATVERIETALTKPLHVFHFAGHGRFDPSDGSPVTSADGGRIVLFDPPDSHREFTAAQLAINLKSRVRLAVLSACETGTRDPEKGWTGIVPALVKNGGVPAVVGMQYAVTDDSAIVFGRRFYDLLVEGDPLDFAVTVARIAVFDARDVPFRDFGIPVLYVRTDNTVVFPRPPVVAEPWSKVRARAADQARRAVAKQAATGRFLADTYVKRAAADRARDKFLRSREAGLLVTGASGTGKTSLLCQWSADLAKAGHAAFFYDCGTEMATGVRGQLAADLGLDDPAGVEAALAQLAQQAVKAKKQIVVLFANLGDFRGAGGPTALLKDLEAIVSALPPKGVNVVVSCAETTWANLSAGPGWAQRIDLQPFTADEFDAAFTRYRRHFELRTDEPSDGARRALSLPVLLRLAAETFAGGELPADVGGSIALYAGSFERLDGDQREFLLALADVMVKERRASVPTKRLTAKRGVLRSGVENLDPSSPYRRLLDTGVLRQTFSRDDVADVVSFVQDRFGAYVVAHAVDQERSSLHKQTLYLVDAADEFALGSEVARFLVRFELDRDPNQVATLAAEPDARVQTVIADAVGAFAADEPSKATAFTQGLLENEKTRDTGLRAAANLGAASLFEVLRWVARKDDDDLRRQATYLLYLRWTDDPGGVDDVLNELAKKMSPLQWRNVTPFLGHSSVTIYINNCENPDVITSTDALWFEVLTKKLHLNIVNRRLIRTGLVAGLAGAGLTSPIADALLGDTAAEQKAFFRQSAATKKAFETAIPLVNPAAPLGPAEADVLLALLDAPLVATSILAALVIGIHAFADFAGSKRFIRELYDRAEPEGKWWVLRGFTVLLDRPAVAKRWAPFLEDLTEELLADHPDSFFQGTYPRGLDLSLLPLGLACLRAGRPMTLIEQLLEGAVGDADQAKRCFGAFAPVGLYDADAFLKAIDGVTPQLDGDEIPPGLTDALGLVRTLRPGPVDRFLLTKAASPNVINDVRAAGQVRLVRNYLYFVGLYNNAVHQALVYERMRDGLLINGLKALIASKGKRRFIIRFTDEPLRMLKDANYRLIEWTKPR